MLMATFPEDVVVVRHVVEVDSNPPPPPPPPLPPKATPPSAVPAAKKPVPATAKATTTTAPCAVKDGQPIVVTACNQKYSRAAVRLRGQRLNVQPMSRRLLVWCSAHAGVVFDSRAHR